MNGLIRIRRTSILTLLSVVLWMPTTIFAQGIFLHGLGPVNRSMGGASVAAPLDALGAIHWNPAAISGLESSELTWGLELLLADLTVSSSVPGLAGQTSSEPGVLPIPNVGWVHKDDDSAWTYGLGVLAVAGVKNNYPSSNTNPVLLPQPSAASGGVGGLGRVLADAQFLQLVPTASFAVTEWLSIGFAPTINIATINVDPFAFASPDDANGDGFPSYPLGQGARSHWGGGFQVGIYYIAENDWHLGASFKSPQWFEEFRFHSEDEVGGPRVVKAKIDLPMIVSLGAAYSGIDRYVFALDIRYIDYKNTDGFGPSGFDATGALRGLGWSSVFALGTGMQYEWDEGRFFRLGYTYNQSPISNNDTFVNIGPTTITQHTINAGTSCEITDYLAVNLAFTYYVDNQKTGPITLPAGTVPGSSVTSDVNAYAISLGTTVRY